jgi:hypothetical protein
MHQSLGLCARCYGLATNRLKHSILKHSTLDPVPPELTENLTRKVKNAQQAIAAIAQGDTLKARDAKAKAKHKG